MPLSSYITRMRKTLSAYDNIETHHRLEEMRQRVLAQLRAFPRSPDTSSIRFNDDVSVGRISSTHHIWSTEASLYFTYDDILMHPKVQMYDPTSLNLSLEEKDSINDINLVVAIRLTLKIPDEDYHLLGRIGKITTEYSSPREVLACGV